MISENFEEFDRTLEKAREHLEKKQYKNARLMYFQAQNSTDDESVKAIIWTELSWVYYYEKEYEKAVEAAENVLFCDKDYKALDDLNRVLGYSYICLKNYSLAEQYLSRSLEVNSNDEKQQYVKFELGKLYFNKGNYDLAYPFFQEILEFFEKTNQEYALSVLFYLGFIYYYLNNFKKSREYFNRITAAQPESVQRQASALFGLAFVEFNEKNYLNVISICEKIISLDENFFDKESIGFLTAASYFYLGRKDIFSEYCEQMKKAFPQGRYKRELEELSKIDPSAPAKENTP